MGNSLPYIDGIVYLLVETLEEELARVRERVLWGVARVDAYWAWWRRCST